MKPGKHAQTPLSRHVPEKLQSLGHLKSEQVLPKNPSLQLHPQYLMAPCTDVTPQEPCRRQQATHTSDQHKPPSRERCVHPMSQACVRPAWQDVVACGSAVDAIKPSAAALALSRTAMCCKALAAQRSCVQLGALSTLCTCLVECALVTTIKLVSVARDVARGPAEACKHNTRHNNNLGKDPGPLAVASQTCSASAAVAMYNKNNSLWDAGS